MNRAVKIISIVAVLAFFVVLGRSCYQVLCISCTPAPIKTYNYSGTMDQFDEKIRQFAAINPGVNLTISSRDSTIRYSAKDINIKVKSRSNNVRYELVLYDFNGSTKLDLEGIYDETHNTGGTNMKDKDVEKLYNGFKTNFLPQLSKSQGIVLKIDWFNF
ncbi:MAG TPA: hypothetical protein VL442_00065 [Mucilaginibacter sp.]|jgi:hypothetical protein|nr:hypothetical protein [Mucilaginibacter sp.]